MTVRETIALLQKSPNLDVELLTIVDGRLLSLNTLEPVNKDEEASYNDEDQELQKLRSVSYIFNGKYTQDVCILYHQPFYDYDH